MTAQLTTYPTRDDLWRGLAMSVCGALGAATTAKKRASCALPGGTTPGPLFDLLMESRGVSWSRVSVLPTDERWLPAGAPGTNERLLRERLLVDYAASANLISLRTDHATPHDAADAVGRMLARERVLPLDLCVLGLGEDGHVASLIEGAAGFEHAMTTEAPVAALEAPGAAGAADRLSLSFREIVASRRVMMVFLGSAKRAVFDAATRSPLRELVAQTAVEAHWSA